MLSLMLQASLNAQLLHREQTTTSALKGKLTYKIIAMPGNTYCYDIFHDGKLLIHQPNIPGLPGNNAFVRKADAEKVARRVIKKIQMGIMPPTIHTRELNELKIKY